MCRSLRGWAFVCGALVVSSGAWAQEPSERLFFEGDMVRAGGPDVMRPGCVLASQFRRGETVVWRVRVLSASGEEVSSENLDELVVELPDGQSFPMEFGPHPRNDPTDHFWTGIWKIPQDYPTGSLSYSVVATAPDGATHEWAPFMSAPSQLSVVAEE